MELPVVVRQKDKGVRGAGQARKLDREKVEQGIEVLRARDRVQNSRTFGFRRCDGVDRRRKRGTPRGRGLTCGAFNQNGETGQIVQRFHEVIKRAFTHAVGSFRNGIGVCQKNHG